MRFARCRADEVSIVIGERSRRYGAGALVDLEDVIAPAEKGTDGRPAITLRDALGHRVDAFEVFEHATNFDEAAAEARRRDAVAAAASMTLSDATDATQPESPSPVAVLDTPGADGAPQRATPDADAAQRE